MGTSGSAHVGPLNIKNDINKIYPRMGVCPQHDILWPTLTAKEHLLFFGRLKGIFGKELSRLVRESLECVNLTEFQNVQAGSFSGGMKRRLSVANSLIGNPSVCYMDEPSTGLDPASRKQLWDVISKAKGNKSIVLTTHSMEEADVLCDRIAIMANGQIQCLGISSLLKLRFGAGYMFTISVGPSVPTEKIQDFVQELFPSSKLLNEPIAGKFKYTVVREEVVLSSVFAVMEERKNELGVVDWGITETTLEEVFLKLARLANQNLGKLKRSLSDLARFGDVQADLEPQSKTSSDVMV